MGEVRVGVVGTGNMGSAHIAMIRSGQVPGMRLTAVCDSNAERLSAYTDVQTFTDSRKLARSGAVDAIIIATPHYFHTTTGIDALKAGLHVLVEKPISAHKADALRLLAAHTNTQQVFATVLHYRTQPRYAVLRELIQSGQLGEITRINWIVTNWFRTQAYYDNGGWRATWKGEGGGVLINQSLHNLDLWQWLFGMPVRVRALCGIGRHHAIEVEDDVTATMEYANGATGVFITSTGEAPGTDRLEITAENGKVVLENGAITWTKNLVGQSAFCRTSTEGFAMPPTWNVAIPCHGEGEGHLVILANFAAAILRGEPLLAPAEEGIRSVELANAMLYSSFTGKAVDLPLSAPAYERLLNRLIASSTFVKKTVAAPKVVDLSASFKR
ncbi:MAG: Gfo/Idh/MocA family oxidoreductase [Kiritimatiellaeota bacterium]|nr:Gfo/Idh/MocA family oxidoreductase [Kiritimatiellota bacterium]